MRAYLDHAATSPLDPRVAEALLPWATGSPGSFGNASSAHARGRWARAAVEQARDRVADALGVEPLEVLFTSGATEADNLAVKGLAWARRDAGRGAHLVTTAIEHRAVLDACRWLAEAQGFSLTVVAPEPDGVVDADAILAAVRSDTALVACSAANGELGTVQPVGAVASGLVGTGVALHVDAAQAVGRVPVNVAGFTTMAVSAHKLGGPQGAGVLVLRRDAIVTPLLHGGAQERGVRSGTLDVVGAVGCGVAIAEAVRSQPFEALRVAGLRDRLRAELTAVDGVAETVAGPVLPSHLHVGVAGCDGETLLAALDEAGVEVSLGSACASGAVSRSYVLDAIGAAEDHAHLRWSLGRTTTEAEVEHAAGAFCDVVKRLRDAGGGFL